jgi:hypothetical protein
METMGSIHAQGKDLGEAFQRLSAEVDRAAGAGQQGSAD